MTSEHIVAAVIVCAAFILGDKQENPISKILITLLHMFSMTACMYGVAGMLK